MGVKTVETENTVPAAHSLKRESGTAPVAESRYERAVSPDRAGHLSHQLQNQLAEVKRSLSGMDWQQRRLHWHTFSGTMRTAGPVLLPGNELLYQLCYNDLYTQIQTVPLLQLKTTGLARSTPLGESIADKDIFALITDLMNTVREDYLKMFEDCVAKQTEYWRKFSDVQSKLAQFITADGDKIKLDVEGLRQELAKLMNNEEGTVAEEFIIFPDPATSSSKVTTEEEAKRWAAAMGLPETCVVHVDRPEEGFVVTVDQSPVYQMFKDLNDLTTDKSITMNQARFQAWQTGFNAQAENMKTSCQTVTSKYSSANSLYDTLIKLLSSTISSMTDSAKGYLNY